jgi:hypothetical protein
MAGDDVNVPKQTRLPDAPRRQYPFELPLPISVRLDELLYAVKDAGGHSSRREIVAALIFQAAVDGEALDHLLHRYRRAAVGDLAPAEGENVVRMPLRRPPGPRSG